MGVSLLEKQNWYIGDNLGNIPLIYLKGRWTGEEFKIIKELP